MKRAIFLVNAYAYLVLLCSHACSGAAPQPGSPEAVVSKAMDAVNHGRIDEFVSAMRPRLAGRVPDRRCRRRSTRASSESVRPRCWNLSRGSRP